MNKLALLTLLLLGTFFNTSQQKTETIQEIIKLEKPEMNNGFTVKGQEYTLHFEIENTNNKQPTLMITFELHNDSHFMSPLTKKDLEGKFNMDLGSYTHLGFKGDIIETLQSIEKIHPTVVSTVKWVRENTIYRQPLEIKTQEDFEVFGRIQFTIKPRNTFEEIPFSISYKNGVLKISSPKGC